MALTIEYAGHKIFVDLPEEPSVLLEFIKNYFIPYFSFTPAEPKQQEHFANITVHIAPLPENCPDFPTEPIIDIDKSQGFLNCWGALVIDERGNRWVELRPFGVVVKINKNNKTIEMWGNCAAVLRIPLLRIIEDLTVNEVQNAGGIVLHGSAVVGNGRAVLAIGNKGAGKTTTLCRCLHGFDVAKMANDNVCLWLNKSQIIARGWPGFFKVEIATVASHSELARDFPANRRQLLNDNKALWDTYEKISLYPVQGAQRFLASVIPQAPLGCLVFPKFCLQKPPELLPISLEEVGMDIPQYLQGNRHPNHPDWTDYNPVDNQTVDANLEKILAALTEKIPLYRMNWTPSIDDLLGQIPLLRSTKKSVKDCASITSSADGWPPLPHKDRPESI